MLGIGDAIRAIDQRDVAVVLEIRGGVTVLQTVRIEAEERVVGEEQRASAADSNVELDSVIGVPVTVLISVRTG